MGNIIVLEINLQYVKHPTTQPKDRLKIPKSKDITKWEENILKLIRHQGQTKKDDLITTVFYDEECLDTSIDRLLEKHLIEEVHIKSTIYYELNREKIREI